ncbi:MAG TPA: DUF3696 domain-containing protein [Chloroflexota bacterium]|nr:DUF3696 domain-containing protein [Chloroflexota bacterium]
MTAMGNRERWPSGLGAWDALAIGDEALVDTVSDWLADEDRLGAGYELRRRQFKELDLSDPLVVQLLTGRAFDEVEEAHINLVRLPTRSRLVLMPKGSNLELEPHDIGIGISQVIPVLVTALAGAGVLSAIEQPELHLHPKLQAELGDLFIDSAISRGQRFLIETHSEHLILRLLRRIRETHDGELPPGHSGLTPEQVSVVYIEKVEDDVRAYPLRIDETGEFLDRWPKGFFEERAEELF